MYGHVLRTEAAEDIPRHFKVTRSFPELLMMTADSRVRGRCGLSFDASPPNVLLSSNWMGGGSEDLDETEGSSEGTIYVNFRLRKHA